MKLKQQAIKRLEELKPEALARVYDLIAIFGISWDYDRRS